MSYSMDVLYYLRILRKYKIMILLCVIAAAIIAMLSGLLIKRTYTSAITVLLPQSGVGSQISNISNVLGLPNINAPSSSDIVIRAILSSRRMMEGIVDKFNLQQRYGISSKDRAIQIARSMVYVYGLDTRSATMSIEVTAEEPQLACDIANYFVNNLNIINDQIKISSERELVKVLDPAIPSSRPNSRHIPKRMAMASIAIFFITNLLCFSVEYYKTLKGVKK